jgi:prevent-host-death family protein
VTKVQIAQLRDHVSHYVHRAERGETILIVNRTRPVAALGPYVPARRSRKSLVGLLKGTARIEGDLVSPSIPPAGWFRS